MSASEMERLKAEYESIQDERDKFKARWRIAQDDRNAFELAKSQALDALADWKSLHADEVGHHNQTMERLREVERVWREGRGDVEAAIRLAVYAPLPQNPKCADDAVAGAAAFTRIDAALSGSSAPQAPNSEELLKALRAARVVIDRDRTGLAAGLNEVKKIAAGYAWIMDGEWAATTTRSGPSWRCARRSVGACSRCGRPQTML